jgi:hypothetical protein
MDPEIKLRVQASKKMCDARIRTPGSAHHHNFPYNGFDARIRTPGSARHQNFHITVLTPGSVLPGSARHHGEEFFNGSDARIRTPRIRASSWRIFFLGSAIPDPRGIKKKHITVLHARIRMPESARHHKRLIAVQTSGSALPDPRVIKILIEHIRTSGSE